VNGNFVNNAQTPNDGQEVLAYMPGAVVQSIHSTTNALDYSNTQYAHNFSVDATPAAGDLFFGGQWHSWLVGGLGPGGAALYALDVTNPSSTNFVEGNAASLVIGEWTPATVTCTNVSNCGNSMGNTYGTPQIRRLHNGTWAAIFGNGYGSATGDAGIFIMTLDPTTAAPTFYYLSTATGSAANPNGIAFASAADLDGDHITDYVYAGDLQGNVWRFDLTSNNPANWAVTPGPLFKTPAGQPITTAVAIAGGSLTPGAPPLVMVLFGTGQKIPLTTTSPTTYASGTQSLYGVWDWNMSAWNAMGSAQYASLAPAAAVTLTGPNYTISQGNLQTQVVTVNATTQDREIPTNAIICWAGGSSCTSANNQYGWYINLPGAQEQIIYNPELVAQALTVNTIAPAPNTPTSCTQNTDTGFTYVVSALTGGAFNQVFLPLSETKNPNVNNNPAYTDTIAVALLTNATGSSFITGNSAGTAFLVYETNANNGNGTVGLNLPPNTTGRRLSWIERR
jgi:type IV pilus assembly protein PilY1